MTELHEVVSPNDSGSDTFARFKYQAHVMFPYCLRLAQGNGVTEVFAEHVEDIAVHESGSWRFLQVKSREAGRGPWTFAEAVHTRAFRSLWRAYQAAASSLEATYELCLEGAVRNDDVLLRRLVEDGELDIEGLDRVADDLGVSADALHDFAARLRVCILPPLRSITAENIRLLGRAAPGVAAGQIERTYEDAVSAIEAAMEGARLGGDWPAALFLPPDERSRLRLEVKRIGRERAEEIFAPVLRAAAVAATSLVVVPSPTSRAPFILPQLDVPTFTGRSTELERLEAILLRQEGEKVSSIAGVSGAGGIGKSALACHFAEVHREAFPDGVIGLRVNGREPIGIARECARHAGAEVDPDDERDASTLMQEVFRDRRALLIFDNAEDTSLRSLLPGGTRCAVIITTRDRGLPVLLGISEAARLDLSPLPPNEAVALLERLVGQRVTADPDTAGRICGLVGHLPLAIQIAGATLQMQDWLALQDYALALREEKERLALLRVRGDSELDVRASFSLSLRFLAPGEIDFFASLAVCAQDGFSLMSAAAANGCDERTAREPLAHLVRLSLVNSSSVVAARFVLHPLLRLFAREQGEERDVLTAAETRHREFYAALVKSKTRHGADAEAAALLGNEIDDIVVAAESMARNRALDNDFVLGLQPFFQRHGYWAKAEFVFAAFLDASERANDWYSVVHLKLQQAKFLTLRGRFADAERLLDSLEDMVSHVEPEAARSRAAAMRLNSLGGVLQRQGSFEKAAVMFRRSAEIDRASGNSRGEAITLNSLGGVLQRLGDFKGAVEALRRSEALLTELADIPGQAMVLTSLGGVLQRLGDFDVAAEVLQRSVAIEARLGNERGQAIVLNSLGGVLQRQGKFAEAVEAFRRSYELEGHLGNRRGEAMVLNSLGGVLQRQGKFDEAVEALRRSYTISEGLEDRQCVAMVLNSLGGVLQRQGKFDEAVEAFRRSYGISDELGDQRSVAMVLNSLGGVLQRQGKFDEAVEAFRRSVEIGERLLDMRHVAMVLNSLGGVLQRQGKFDEAVEAFRRSVEIGERLLDMRHVAMALNSLGGVLQRQGKFDEAVEALRKSYELLVGLGDSRGQAMVLNSLGGVLQRQRKLNEAFDAFRTSIAIGEKLRDRRHLAMVHTSFGRALLRADREAAVRELRAGFELDAAMKNRKGVGIVAPLLVETLRDLGRRDEAIAICRRALTVAPADDRLLRLLRELDPGH